MNRIDVEINRLERPISVIVNDSKRVVKVYMGTGRNGDGNVPPNIATVDYVDPTTQLPISGSTYTKGQVDDMIGSGGGGAVGFPTVEIKFIQDYKHLLDDREMRMFAKVNTPTPEFFANKEYQLWLYRRKGAASKFVYQNRREDVRSKAWTHKNEIRELNSELVNSKYYEGGEENLRSEFEIPYFNEWFEVTDFYFGHWFNIWRVKKIGGGRKFIGRLSYSRLPEEEGGRLQSNVPEEDEEYRYEVKAAGSRGKTQNLKAAFVLKRYDGDYPRFDRGELSEGFRIDKKGRVFVGDYIPISKSEFQRKVGNQNEVFGEFE